MYLSQTFPALGKANAARTRPGCDLSKWRKFLQNDLPKEALWQLILSKYLLLV